MAESFAKLKEHSNLEDGSSEALADAKSDDTLQLVKWLAGAVCLVTFHWSLLFAPASVTTTIPALWPVPNEIDASPPALFYTDSVLGAFDLGTVTLLVKVQADKDAKKTIAIGRGRGEGLGR